MIPTLSKEGIAEVVRISNQLSKKQKETLEQAILSDAVHPANGEGLFTVLFGNPNDAKAIHFKKSCGLRMANDYKAVVEDEFRESPEAEYSACTFCANLSSTHGIQIKSETLASAPEAASCPVRIGAGEHYDKEVVAAARSVVEEFLANYTPSYIERQYPSVSELIRKMTPA